MKTTLPIIIQMAKTGKVFEYRKIDTENWLHSDSIHGAQRWNTESIMADWEIREIQEPLKFETKIRTLAMYDTERCQILFHLDKKYEGKLFDLVLTEIKE